MIDILETNLIEIITTVLIGVISFIGIRLKAIYKNIVTEEVKRKTVNTVVYAVEKIYGNLGSDEKLVKAQENIENILKEKCINISEVEMRMLIEESTHSLGRKEG